METLQAIKSRRSIRKFKSDMIPKDILDKIIEAGTYAPTGRGAQSPIIIAVTNKEVRDKLSKMNSLIMGKDENFDPFYNAPVCLIVLANKEKPTYIYSTHFDKSMKVGASVVCARRGGCSATFDELNKYFTISNMPVAPSQYWNSIHGREKGQADLDHEGKQTMRVLAQNMTFLMKSIELGKKEFGLPKYEERIYTHFI